MGASAHHVPPSGTGEPLRVHRGALRTFPAPLASYFSSTILRSAVSSPATSLAK